MEQYMIVGGFLFWAFAMIAAALLLIAVAYESFAGLVVICVSLAILRAAFSVQIFDFMPHTWYGWALCIVGYFSLGSIWSIYKFRIAYREEVERLAKNCADRSLEERRKYVERFANVENMKERIISWIAYWPISILIYLLSDFLWNLCETVYGWFSGIYEGIAKRIRDSIVT